MILLTLRQGPLGIMDASDLALNRRHARSEEMGAVVASDRIKSRAAAQKGPRMGRSDADALLEAEFRISA